jgi:CBS domain-containing protein
MTKTVRQVMMPEPRTVDAATSLEDTARIMRAWDVSEVLVTDGDGRLCGELTAADIAVVAIASGQPPSTITAGQCANPETAFLRADDPVDEAFAVMREHEHRRLPVVDGERLVGAEWIADVAMAVIHPASR